ncbi:hypothetical protein K488DRAFT_87327 [Vararia minispora EC-137]|uniref:Uncharacterized protein n=1 Tax=Vararia minispora EC-137 TaxID=1314806 RepID=A0ACB8QGG3_9AGAM|nr:hypothetical protein K488DRAFT_87327 [Vararia minispora EC-137]
MFLGTLAALSALFFASLSSVAAKDSRSHYVAVGGRNGDLKFYPEYITADKDDVVVFTFNPKNHTATQSTFKKPCLPLEHGFDSGFFPVAIGTVRDARPTFNITVKDTEPVWVYCRQGAFTAESHCGAGMVFAINPGKGEYSFKQFKKNAVAEAGVLASASVVTTASASASATSKQSTYAVSPTTSVTTSKTAYPVYTNTSVTTSNTAYTVPTPRAIAGRFHVEDA